jgi:hydroxyacylglutathione hydrolase
MPTEDHIGDVIAKECFHQKIDDTRAAEVAGLSAGELEEFFESGETAKPVNYEAIAELLGFDPTKLKGIANKWEPAAPNLSQWPGLKKIVTDEAFAVNAYLAWDLKTNECAIFDTGWNASSLIAFITDNGLKPTDFFITHSHHDHIADMTRVRNEFTDLQLHADMEGTPEASKNKRDEIVKVGSLRISNYQTIGHAADGVTYVIDGWPNSAPKVAIVGDAIFAGSMGKGKISGDDAKRTAREAILTLPDNTLICAGHGPFTTVGQEKEHNPFF